MWVLARLIGSARETDSDGWAAMLAGILDLRHQVLVDSLIEGLASVEIEERIDTRIGRALDALERAYPKQRRPPTSRRP